MYKKYMHRNILLEFQIKILLIYIYIFLTLNGPYRIKQNISFFHLKKIKTTKTSADQLTSQIQKTRNML